MATAHAPKQAKSVKSAGKHEKVAGGIYLAPLAPRAVGKAGGAPADEALIRAVLAQALASLQEMHPHRVAQHGAGQLIREVAELLAHEADAQDDALPVEEGWQQLLEAGLKSKTRLLKSKEFKTTAQASELLGIGEPAVRRRIREGKLFALSMPVGGEHRIPAWALDAGLAGTALDALLAQAGPHDAWHLYHFMSTPDGSLNGLKPFECLLSSENLPQSRQVLRDELTAYLQLPQGASLLETVGRALQTEFGQGPQA